MILDEIVAKTKERMEQVMKEVPLEEIKRKALSMDPNTGFPFEKALKKDQIQFICEVKKASPSKGLIAPDFPYVEIAKEYEAAGAAAISVLTEPYYFQGCNEYLMEITKEVSIPVIRKDFTVNEYMIYEAKVIGASAVLLICAVLTDEQLSDYVKLADSLGLSALVETHDEQEMERALKCGARVIGVNNRNLKNFTVDIENSVRLRKMVPDSIVFVSESGIKAAEDIKRLRDNQTDAVLIGETFMRSPNKKEMLRKLRGDYQCSVKLCGLRRKEDIEAVNRIKPEFIGFILWDKSKRWVTYEQAKELKQLLHPQIQAVGVFVDEKKETVLKYLEDGVIDVAQLHGNEPESELVWLKERTEKPIIKMIHMEKQEEMALLSEEQKESRIKELVDMIQNTKADYLLFDSGKGTGMPFAWEQIEKIRDQITKPFFLAGGMDAINAKEAIDRLKPFALDVSSAVETDGVKDEEKMKAFVDVCRKQNRN